MSKFFYTVIIISFMSLIIFPQYLFANNNTSDNIYCEIISCGQKYSINNTQIVIEKMITLQFTPWKEEIRPPFLMK